jgi:nucleoside-diphosphate-sugar epimerase
MAAQQTVLVAGASGLVGQAAVRAFAARPDWNVVAVSRRPLQIADVSWMPLDLADAGVCAAAWERFGAVTHVVYAAVHEVPGLSPGWFDDDVIARNDAMLRNLMEPLLSVADLRHVSLLQGTKAYGLHHPSIGFAGVRNPLRERDPRQPHPNFYFRQEDYLRERLAGNAFGQENAWKLSVFRPTVVYGDAMGTNMNLIPVIGAWAALLREQGEPLHFPGRRISAQLKEAVDADLVARALVWAAESTADGTFNLTNGDAFLWQHVWPVIAGTLDMAAGEHRPTRLVEQLPAAAAQWAALVDRHGLRAPRDIVEFVGDNSLVYADQLLAGHDPPEGPVLNSTVAVRQAGFSDCLDTEDMFARIFTRLRQQRILP